MRLRRWRWIALALTLTSGTALIAASAAASVEAALQPVSRWWQSLSTPQLRVPEGWPRPQYDARHNPVTRAGFELGRRLFYDPLLSLDGSIACASCHQQFAAFAHFDHRVSHGLAGANGTRNAPPLFNLAWQSSFMWDGGVTHLELQPLAPLANPVEMGETLPAVIAKLRRDAEYPALFAAAFGSDHIDGQRFLRALAQFLATLISDASHYDRVLAGRESFSAAESRGYATFQQRCAACHAEPLFSDDGYARDGIDNGDAGRALITARIEDRGRMRVPSLRNLGYSAPYMHDGRYDTLDQVLQHYAHGIRDAESLDARLPPAASLRDDEIADLLAFLDTLNDPNFIDDPRYAEPSAR